MSGLLYGVGAIAVVAGVVMVGFGIPINEFSFGNTLISAGMTAAVGGLIIIGLGVVVTQLKRLNEALATRAPIRSSRPFDTFDNAAGARNAPAPGRVPFPPKPKADADMREPLAPRTEAAVSADTDERQAAPSFAPTLPNPEEAPVTVEDEVSLSPSAPPRVADEPAKGAPRFEPKLDAGWRAAPPPAAPAQTRQPQPNYFDAMWPAQSKPAEEPSKDLPKSPAAKETRTYAPKADLPPREAAPSPARVDPDVPMQRPASETRGVAILKSGVVDGMGYTLYVDGSIEAELPQGTLRFGSINELRSHLEKNA